MHRRSRKPKLPISSRQAKANSPDKNKGQNSKSVMMNPTNTLPVHPFPFRHWDYSTQPTLSMPQKMKPSADACNRRRKRSEVQEYNRKKSWN